MAVVAGIDEAGYGPLLGPLVASATAFRLPDEHSGKSLWLLLKQAVTRGAPRSRRVQVNDSKIVYKPQNGLTSLEKNLLPFLAMLQPLPSSLRGLTGQLGCANAPLIDSYPWYAGRERPLPVSKQLCDIAEHADWLKQKFTSAGVEFCAARSEILDAAEFNREMRVDCCKATPLARKISCLLAHLWEQFGPEGLIVVVDKQGGRNFYSSFLRVTIPDCRMEVIEETAGCSEYKIWDDRGRSARIIFEPYADAHHLPVALGSMLSKYLRELFVGMINEYWIERLPGLKPTAGYYGDGRRFIKEVFSSCQAQGIPLDMLERCR